MYVKSHKRPFVPSVGGTRLLRCMGRGPSQFCETSVKVTNWVTDPLRWSGELCGSIEGILMSSLAISKSIFILACHTCLAYSTI